MTPSLSSYAEELIDVPPEDVWAYFVDVSRWPQWSPICRRCVVRRGQPPGLDETLDMELQLFGRTYTVEAAITAFEPPHCITWRSNRPRATVMHTYRFEPHAQGTRLVNEETIIGLTGWRRNIVGLWLRWRNPSAASLRGLARALHNERRSLPRSRDVDTRTPP